MNKKIKKYLNNKKGAAETINTVVALITILTLFVFFIDIIFFTRTYIGMSNYVDGIARTLAIQGGINPTSPPENFPGGSNLYFNITDVKNNTKEITKKYNIDENDITMYVQSKKYYSSKNPTQVYAYTIPNDYSFKPKGTATSMGSVKAEYGQPITVALQYEFQWTLSKLKAKVKIKRSSISEFKYKDDSDKWEQS